MELCNRYLREKLVINQLSNGLNCYIIPKAGYVEKQAMICVNFGAVDTRFSQNGSVFSLPGGVAHFLEHKLFESKTMNVFNRFMAQGAAVNAFTNYTTTAYLFNCTERFAENLELLLTFTASPYLTDANVEKERSIIAQEISMMEDNPFWRLSQNALGALYHACPVKNAITGKASEIRQISREDLLCCYEAFYRPENMALICVGDIDPDDVMRVLNRHDRKFADCELTRVYPDEPDEVKEKNVEEALPVVRAMADVAFKETTFDLDPCVRLAETKVLMDVLAGESSDFYNGLYEKGAVDGPVGLEYICGGFYGAACFLVTSGEPERFSEALMTHIEHTKANGFDAKRFGQIKNKHIGRMIRGYNVPDAIAVTQADMFSKGRHLFDLLEAYDGMTEEAVFSRLGAMFTDRSVAVSIVRPNKQIGDK